MAPTKKITRENFGCVLGRACFTERGGPAVRTWSASGEGSHIPNKVGRMRPARGSHGRLCQKWVILEWLTPRKFDVGMFVFLISFPLDWKRAEIGFFFLIQRFWRARLGRAFFVSAGRPMPGVLFETRG